MLAVAHDREAKVGMGFAQPRDDPDRQVGSLVRDHAADAGHEHVLRTSAGLRPKSAAIGGRDLPEALEVEAQGNHPELRSRSDPEPDQIVHRRLADAQKAVGALCQLPLDCPVDHSLRAPEVALENVPMKGVDRDRRRLQARSEDREAPEGPRLGRMGVHKVGLVPAHDCGQLTKSLQVSCGTDSGPEAWDYLGLAALLLS